MGNLDLWLLTLNCPLDAVMDCIFGDHFCHSLRVHALGQHSRAAMVQAEALRRPAPAIYLESSRWTFEQVTLGQLRTLLLDATTMEPRPGRPRGGGSSGRQGCPIPILRLRDLVVGGFVALCTCWGSPQWVEGEAGHSPTGPLLQNDHHLLCMGHACAGLPTPCYATPLFWAKRSLSSST